MGELVHEDTPIHHRLVRLILGGALMVPLVIGVVLLFRDVGQALPVLGLTLFHALMFTSILPRKYQIFQDRVKVVLGGPLALNFPLSTITEARSATGWRAIAFFGLRFATPGRNVVQILRHKGMNVVISPTNREVFLEKLNQALQRQEIPT